MHRTKLLVLIALASLVTLGLLYAAATVTDNGIRGAAFTKKTVAFTLNGTTPVTASLSAMLPIKGGSVEGTLGSTPTGTVTLSLYNGDTFTLGQKDLVTEAFASEKLQVGIFENVSNPSTTGYEVGPCPLEFSIVSSSTADTAITGSVVMTLVH